MRSVGMMSSTRAESPQKRGGLWLQLGMCAAMAMLLVAASVRLLLGRYYVEAGYAFVSLTPCVWLAWDAHVAIERIDKQGFLPVRLVTNRF